MNKTETIRWIVTALLRLVAGYVAVRFGEHAIAAETWAALGTGLAAFIIAGLSIYSSVRGRKALLDTKPPE